MSPQGDDLDASAAKSIVEVVMTDCPRLDWQAFAELVFSLVEQLEPEAFGFGCVARLETFPQIFAITDSDAGLPKPVAAEQH